MKLYLFNPDADMALGNNTEHYMPPVSIRRMAEELAILPIWYAEPNSGVLAASAYNADYLKAMKECFGIPMELVTWAELNEYNCSVISPWGWTPALRKQLLKDGMEESRLPTLKQLSEYRLLSGRNIHTKVLDTFKDVPCCVGESYCFSSLTACRDYANKLSGCVFKLPWSGSGKGLCWCYDSFNEVVEKWCVRAIREQGYLMASPIYRKEMDFAMEFYVDAAGNISFVGYSLFEATEKGNYRGNILLPKQELEYTLSARCPLPLNAIREKLCAQLKLVYGGFYQGYLGVDMMLCRGNNGEYLIHPCVEVNLRMNMGVLACRFSERHLATSSQGYFSISHYATHEELVDDVEKRSTVNPLQIVGKRIVQGFMPLVPITPNSRYLAYVDVRIR